MDLQEYPVYIEDDSEARGSKKLKKK